MKSKTMVSTLVAFAIAMPVLVAPQKSNAVVLVASTIGTVATDVPALVVLVALGTIPGAGLLFASFDSDRPAWQRILMGLTGAVILEKRDGIVRTELKRLVDPELMKAIGIREEHAKIFNSALPMLNPLLEDVALSMQQGVLTPENAAAYFQQLTVSNGIDTEAIEVARKMADYVVNEANQPRND